MWNKCAQDSVEKNEVSEQFYLVSMYGWIWGNKNDKYQL